MLLRPLSQFAQRLALGASAEREAQGRGPGRGPTERGQGEARSVRRPRRARRPRAGARARLPLFAVQDPIPQGIRVDAAAVRVLAARLGAQLQRTGVHLPARDVDRIAWAGATYHLRGRHTATLAAGRWQRMDVTRRRREALPLGLLDPRSARIAMQVLLAAEGAQDEDREPR